MTRMNLIRRAKGLKQREVAEEIGYSPCWLSLIENGHIPLARINHRLRQALEAYFNEPLENLLARIEA